MEKLQYVHLVWQNGTCTYMPSRVVIFKNSSTGLGDRAVCNLVSLNVAPAFRRASVLEFDDVAYFKGRRYKGVLRVGCQTNSTPVPKPN